MSKYLIWMAAIAAAFFFVPSAIYVYNFGGHLSPQQDHWGQYGDFVAGVLNPIYALLAFGAVLYNAHLQSEQLNRTKQQFDEQTKSTQEQLQMLRDQASRDELQSLIATIDGQIQALLSEVVSPRNSNPQIRLHELLHLATTNRSSPPFVQYLMLCGEPGSVVQALHSRLVQQADALAFFLTFYTAKFNEGSPVVAYYSTRYPGLGHLLVATRSGQQKTKDFFIRYESDGHTNSSSATC